MPTSNTQGPHQRQPAKRNPDALSLPLINNANSPDPANLGMILIDLRTNQLVAADSQARSRFSLFDSKLDQIVPKSLFPRLTDLQWGKIADRENKNPRSCGTFLSQPANSPSQDDEIAVQLVATPLVSLQQGPLLQEAPLREAAQQELLLISLQVAPSGQSEITHRDALTGLPDRRELTAHLQRWRQTSENQAVPFALLFLDLDQFKQINDQQGHAVGDQVLVTLAQRWQNCVREGDLVVRYGGDEIVILIKGVITREEVDPVLERLTQATTKTINVGDRLLQVGVTIGVTLSNSSDDQLEDLLQAADHDMYAAKRSKMDLKPR